jgi:hypothetical protein
MRLLPLGFLLLFILACKKHHPVSENTILKNTKTLNLSDVQSHLKLLLSKKRSQNGLKDRLAMSKEDLKAIGDGMDTETYQKFIWDYATIEENIDGHPAILVPIKMQEQVNVSIADDMSPLGYRVAVFQHSPDKTEILLSFRDYHPDESIVRQRMGINNITIYPRNFIEFHELLGNDFTGYVLALNEALQPLRLIRINHNTVIKYVNLPQILIAPTAQNIPFNQLAEEAECQVQVLYPDYETSIISESYSYYDSTIALRWDNINKQWVMPGIEIGYRSYTRTSLVWKTETMSTPCQTIKRVNVLNTGVNYNIEIRPINIAHYEEW